MEDDKRLLERILDGVEDPRDLPFSLLKDITNNFSGDRIIGQGGFGEVYKGLLGERIVAVKRIHINAHTFDDKLFRREVTSLLNCNHRNVVQFLGVCCRGYQKPIEKDGSREYVWANVLERLLCFRYISNGSLDRHITDELRGLEWKTRYEIITGICKGLLYLHKEKNIIHMDLKPANILLDHQNEKYMVPKITDFGLSRPNKNSHTVGQRYGKLEYMAPEYKEENKTTQSCDIYSLGLIIIELVTGCKDVPNKDNVLRRWRHRWQKPPTQLQYQQVTRCIEIAGHCRRKNPKDRPSISKIISFLGESESTYQPICPCLDEDYMLRINPLEIQLPSELKNDTSFSVELTNHTRNCIIAFNIQLPSIVYKAQPAKGIVRPESKYSVKITVHARNVGGHDHANKFIIQSMQVKANEGLRDEDITERIFEKTGRIINEVDLMVVYGSTKHHDNFKRSEDTTNTPALEVLEGKNCDSSSSSSGKAEAKSMVWTNLNSTERRNTRHIINRPDKNNNVSNESEYAAEAKMLQGSDKIDGMAVVAPSDIRLLPLYENIPNYSEGTRSKLVHKDLVFKVKNGQGYEINQLRNLTNLHGSLVISGLGNVTSREEALEANLTALEHLTELTLEWDPSDRRCSSEVEADVLEALCPPVGLKKLEISIYEGSRYPDWMMGKRNSGPKDLRELDLFTDVEGPAPQIVEAFPHLRVLWLCGGSWDALPSNMEQLTSLKELAIGHNKRIQSLPTLPGSLEEFDLFSCDPKFMKSCKTVGHPNWQKIKHIPEKTFEGLSTIKRLEVKMGNIWRAMTM
ncbi:unnamed protein product [Alopecurus aequalis]